MEGFGRRVAARPVRFGARIRSVWERDEFGLPSFWVLQILGWAGFYGLILLTIVLPSHSKRELWNQTICWTAVFAGSWMLRPACRAMLQKPRPWLVLESWAFALSVAVGAVCTFATEIAKSRGRVAWGDSLEDWLQSAVMLFLWCTLYFSIKQWQQAMRERERLVRAESEVREARLTALRYQLNPHFLFNSLNAASTLVLQGRATAATRMLAQIGELLRTTLDNDASAQVPLSQELAFVEQYLAIEQTRLGDRLRVSTAISRDTLDAVVPSMLLQPLVENAVRHGVAPLIEGGTIAIASSNRDGRLLMTIKNSGPRTSGLPPGDAPQNGGTSKGIGLANTAERLKTLYGDDQRFSCCSPEEGGYEVAVEIPFRKDARAPEGGVCAR
jgi:two-component system, LytTR family, sensor kinase